MFRESVPYVVYILHILLIMCVIETWCTHLQTAHVPNLYRLQDVPPIIYFMVPNVSNILSVPNALYTPNAWCTSAIPLCFRVRSSFLFIPCALQCTQCTQRTSFYPIVFQSTPHHATGDSVSVYTRCLYCDEGEAKIDRLNIRDFRSRRKLFDGELQFSIYLSICLSI